MRQFASVVAMAMLVVCSVAAVDRIIWPPFFHTDVAEAETVKRSPQPLPPQFRTLVYVVSSRVQQHYYLYYDQKSQRIAAYSPEPIFGDQLTSAIQLCGQSMMYVFNSSYCKHAQTACKLTNAWIPQNATLVTSCNIGEEGASIPVDLWSYQGQSYLVEKTMSAPIEVAGEKSNIYFGDFNLEVDFSKFTPPPYCFQSRRLFLDRL
jgi:hypothetical protein